MKTKKNYLEHSFRRYVVLIFLAWLTLGLATTLKAEDTCQPQPLEHDLILPGPHGVCFVFRPVSLGEGGDLFASRRFSLGDPSGGFREHPTAVALGGSFLVPQAANPDKSDWIYYLGKYELTEGQYYAIMGLPEGGAEELYKSLKPMTSLTYFEAQALVDKLNAWLFANALDALPKNGQTPGFIRLPTEPEWEFAARGGSLARLDFFSGRHPYEEALNAHEWFAGPSSSHNKIQNIGKLKPNVLGLHDMLGNVSEMTSSLYQIEYYQGRYGGLTARGGHFLTDEKKINAAQRTEEPFYIGDVQKGLKPNKKATMGVRLAIGAPVMTSQAEIAALEEAWDEYMSAAGSSLPAGVSTAPVGQRTAVKTGDARQYIQQIKKRLPDLTAEAQAAIGQDLGFIEAALTDVDRIRKDADDDSALAWVRMGNMFAIHAAREQQKLASIEKIIQMQASEGASEDNKQIMHKRKAEIEYNINEAMVNYLDAFNQMAAIDQGSIKSAFEKHRQYLEELDQKDSRYTLEIFEKHYTAFFTGRKPDVETWRQDFKPQTP